MHEMSLCEGILRVLEQQAAERRFSRVARVRLEVGALACVEPAALRFSFDAVTRRTLADGARLELVEIPGRAWCMRCAQEIPVHRRGDDCPVCSDPLTPAVGGDALRITELEVT